MSSSCPRLPPEVWGLVFAYLSPPEAFQVRSTNREFKELLDRSGALRNCTVVLMGKYEKDFWSTIRHWGVTSAVIASPENLSIKTLANELPDLTSLTINCWLADVEELRIFTKLRQLYFSDLLSQKRFYSKFGFLPPQLTHLSVCQPMWIMDFVPNHKQLKSFVCHCQLDTDAIEPLYFLLCALPALEHLSLAGETMMRHYAEEMIEEDMEELDGCVLASLEIVNCDLEMLSMNFSMSTVLRALPFLRNLSIFCGEKDDLDDHVEKLSTLLSALPALSSLLVQGVEVAEFVESIPPAVTRLTLMPNHIKLEEMELLSARLPNLRHLHLEPQHVFLAKNTAKIPLLFPGLRSLRILFRERKQPEWVWRPEGKRRRQRLTSKVFLSLASLKELELLEMQDERLPPTTLVSKLGELTQNRVHICLRPEKDQLQRACHCLSNISCRLSNTWATE